MTAIHVPLLMDAGEVVCVVTAIVAVPAGLAWPVLHAISRWLVEIVLLAMTGFVAIQAGWPLGLPVAVGLMTALVLRATTVAAQLIKENGR